MSERAVADGRLTPPGSVHVRDFGPVPLLEPLCYPGRPVTSPTLLDGELLHPLDPSYPVAAGRVPVLAVGSNGSPAQLSHKLARAAGVSRTVPMEPVLAQGLAVGLSGHVSRVGYVAASPFLAPGTCGSMLLTWLDPDQLALVDSTEVPNYRRVFLPSGAVPVARPDGSRPAPEGAYLYVNARGLLGRSDGTLRPQTDQHALLTQLLAESAALRALCGSDPTPHGWLRRAAETPQFATGATQLLQREGLLMERPDFDRFAPDPPR
ncbi:hypothetical protein JGS22_008240 [Streptomyces sp. P38-E01]|uniref:Uncharacterized protein n=1 Tax=Streptomyces tardus TaxID=2780544 RepID=A0A949JD01_9ACTN|nr:hypothetical protein [Streptomyces tardus]MBU7597611.1 hypothetical protein [Streptomyces tardus]